MDFNKLQSDIINYRPDLTIQNVPSLGDTFGGTSKLNSVKVVPDTVSKSKCLSVFEENLPSVVIEEMEELIEKANEFKSVIKSNMSTTNMGSKFLSANDDYTREQIAKENSSMVAGTTYIEAYQQIESILDELTKVKDVYSNATYGESVSSLVARSIDNADVDKVYTLEREEDSDNVNYTSIYYESLVSAIMQRYCFHMGESVLCDIGNLTEFSKNIPKDDKLIQLMSQNFHKKEQLLQRDIFKDEKTSYNVSVALRNTFFAIQDYEDSLDAIKNSLTKMNDDVLALELQRDLLTNLSEKMEDLLSITTYSIMAKQDISKSLVSKSNIREYFL